MENGTYASILTVAYEFYDIMGVLAAPGLTFGLSGSGAGKITISNSAVFSVTWTDTGLRDILGFTANLSGASSYTASNRPMFTWISDYTPRDREWWHFDHKKTFAGSVARDGTLVGLANGNQIYYRTLGFDAEAGSNVFSAIATSTTAARSCLDTLIEGARSASPSTSTNAPTHGLWYVYDIENLSIQSKSQMSGENGIRHLTSKWAWCHLDADGMREPKASLGVGRSWYSLEIDLHTATEPTWDAPTPPA
jgi:hypothetical protein